MNRQEIIASLASQVSKGEESFSKLTKSMGLHWANDVQAYMTQHAITDPMAGKRIVMRFQRDENARKVEMFAQLAAAGVVLYRPKQSCYTQLVHDHLNSCESGEYLPVRVTATEIAGNDGLKLLSKKSKSKLRNALEANSEHPGLQRIMRNTSKSLIVAVISGSVSNFLTALASLHKAALQSEYAKKSNCELRIQKSTLEARIISLTAKLSLLEKKEHWTESARSIRAMEPEISNRKLASLCAVSEGAIRKYLKGDCPAMPNIKKPDAF